MYHTKKEHIYIKNTPIKYMVLLLWFFSWKNILKRNHIPNCFTTSASKSNLRMHLNY